MRGICDSRVGRRFGALVQRVGGGRGSEGGSGSRGLGRVG